MAQTGDVDRLRRIRDELRDELASIGDFRPGTLVEITRKCGKAGCRCARSGDPATAAGRWRATSAAGG